jgi:predicted enzyme related to lactoylglutathione lyase
MTFQRANGPLESGSAGRCPVDFYVPDPDAAAEQAEKLGARVVRRVAEGGAHWVVIADPDGNEFCLVAALGPDRQR